MRSLILFLFLLISCSKDELIIEVTINDMSSDLLIEDYSLPHPSRIISLSSDGGTYMWDTKYKCKCEWKGEYCLPINTLNWSRYLDSTCKLRGVIVSDELEYCGYYVLEKKYVKFTPQAREVYKLENNECKSEIKQTVMDNTLEELNEVDFYRR